MDTTHPSASPEPAQTHEAIVALLRDHQKRAHDPSELNIAPGAEETVTAAPSIAPAIEVAPVVAPVAAAPVHQEPAFEPIPPPPAAEPIALTPPAEPPLRASASSDIKMDADLHQPPTRPGRGLLRFVTMVFVGIAATIAWQVFGETALEKIAGHTAPAAEPQATASPQAAAATPPAAAAAAPAVAAPAQAVAATTPPPAEPAQAQAALPADVTQKMEAMSREIASLKQTVEQLKASQLQMNRDLAKTMEQEVKRKNGTLPAKQTSAPQAQPQPQLPPQRAAAAPPPQPTQASAAPVPPPQPTYGQPQMYGQSRVYDRPPPTYGRSTDEPYATRPYVRNYDSADVDRDVYVPPPPPPPSPNYQPGYTTVPRPPMPMQ